MIKKYLNFQPNSLCISPLRLTKYLPCLKKLIECIWVGVNTLFSLRMDYEISTFLHVPKYFLGVHFVWEGVVSYLKSHIYKYMYQYLNLFDKCGMDIKLLHNHKNNHQTCSCKPVGICNVIEPNNHEKLKNPLLWRQWWKDKIECSR